MSKYQYVGPHKTWYWIGKGVRGELIMYDVALWKIDIETNEVIGLIGETGTPTLVEPPTGVVNGNCGYYPADSLVQENLNKFLEAGSVTYDEIFPHRNKAKQTKTSD